MEQLHNFFKKNYLMYICSWWLNSIPTVHMFFNASLSSFVQQQYLGQMHLEAKFILKVEFGCFRMDAKIFTIVSFSLHLNLKTLASNQDFELCRKAHQSHK